MSVFFFFQAEDGIRDYKVTGVQTCALPISLTEFLSDGISLLETDLLEISDTGKENVDDIAVFKERYRFAFPAETPPSNFSHPQPAELWAGADIDKPEVAPLTAV